MRMRYLVLLLAWFTLEAHAQGPKPGVVDGTYDRFKDLGALSVHWDVLPSVGTSSLGEVTMRIYLAYRGEPGKTDPAAAFVRFSAITSELTYLKHRSFGCIVDGERLNFDKSEHDSSILGHEPFSIHEQVAIDVPLAFVKTLAFSNKAECRLGLREFEISDPFRVGLRALVARGFPEPKPQAKKTRAKR